MSAGRVKMRELFKKAIVNDEKAIRKLFAGFLGENENISACGYLGVLGYIFPERSFWCVTNFRICGLLIRRGGRIAFTSGFLQLVNSVAFNQPSLVLLWVIIIGWVIAVTTGGFFLGTTFDISLALTVIVAFAVSLLLSRWVVRFYYRFRKSGCVFWMRERIPVFLFADRANLVNAQKLIAHFTATKMTEEKGIYT